MLGDNTAHSSDVRKWLFLLKRTRFPAILHCLMDAACVSHIHACMHDLFFLAEGLVHTPEVRDFRE